MFTIDDVQPHVECSRDPVASRAYCSKEETRADGPYEVGVWVPPAEKASSFASLRDLIKKGASDLELYDSLPNLAFAHFRGIQHYRYLLANNRNDAPEIILIYGPTGVGKSKLVAELYPQAFWKPPLTKWFNGYTGQDTVVFDDFNSDWSNALPLTHLLRLCDRYPIDVETKGSQIKFAPKTILFTSNYLPFEWYPNALPSLAESLLALYRRFTKIYLWNSTWKTWDIHEGRHCATKLAALQNLHRLGNNRATSTSNVNEWSFDNAPELYEWNH